MNWIKCSDELPELLPYGDDETILESKPCFVWPPAVATYAIDQGDKSWFSTEGEFVTSTHWMYAEEPK